MPAGDGGALAAAILRLVRDDGLRERLRANSLIVIADRADRVKRMRRAEEIYETLAAGRTPHPPQEVTPSQ